MQAGNILYVHKVKAFYGVFLVFLSSECTYYDDCVSESCNFNKKVSLALCVEFCKHKSHAYMHVLSVSVGHVLGNSADFHVGMSDFLKA